MEFLNEALNGLSAAKYGALMLYMTLGVAISIGSEQFKFFNTIKKSGGFKAATWIQENWKRVMLVIIVMHLAVVFGQQFTGNDPTIYGSLMTGLTIDVLIDRLFNRKK